MRRALVSVTDKSGITDFCSSLVAQGFEIVSTGGTASALRHAGVPVKDVSEVTGFPEMLDGRVKTLHPKIHGAILADRRLSDHKSQVESAGIAPFDIVCVNLYDFEDTVLSPHTFEEAVESIDIGGPAMIRAAAKNHVNVLIVVDPNDYEMILQAVADGESSGLRQSLAAKAFRHTAFYDSLISRYLTDLASEDWTEKLTVGLRREIRLRYGENPHQAAALFLDPLCQEGVSKARQLCGKELSFNNLLDADAAWELVCDLPAKACTIIKHGNPCGVATASTFNEAYRLAKSTDPVSAFGGIAAFNGPLSDEDVVAFTEKGNFLEVVLATSWTEDAVEAVRSRGGWGQDARLLECPISTNEPVLSVRSIRGGALVQMSDEEPLDQDWKIVTSRQPSEEEWEDLKLAWTIVKHVKSNGIVLVKGGRMTGVGAGQMNRVQSVRLAVDQAGEDATGAVLASDAFFPFTDNIEVAAEAGVIAVIQPGGSKKDQEVAAKAEELGLTMVLTGVRHFRH